MKKQLVIKRHDLTADKSLRAHSAADEYLLNHLNELNINSKRIAIYNDRFGYLSCHLSASNPIIILTNKSQEKAIQLNLKANNLPLSVFADPLTPMEENIDFAIMKAPKSLSLFQAFLEQIVHNSSDKVTVVVSFMTRHFTRRLLEISGMYFESVEQSKAIKKSRLLTLTQKRKVDKLDIIDVLEYKDHLYKQYWGVFSSKHIDYATQYFLNHLEVSTHDKFVLDLASGNGVIAKEISRKTPEAEIHLIDDFFLAVESAKLNITGENIHHHYSNGLTHFEDEMFDLIATNPPFHFEYEVNIQTAVHLFKECFRCLKVGGNLQVVASKHLNYLTHLKPIFTNVEVVAENDKFIIYKCVRIK